MTTRTHRKWSRVYSDGYDISGYVRNWGSLGAEFAAVGEPAVSDALHGFLPGRATPVLGSYTALLDNTSNGLHDKFSGANEMVTASVAIGMGAVPASGDPVFAYDMEMTSYVASLGDDIAINCNFSGSTRATTLIYPPLWGNVIHALGAETGANSTTSDHDHGAQTTLGGYMVYHLTTSNGTCTLKVQDASADNDGSYSDLLSSGSIDASSTPAAAVVALGRTATVERYTRWQLALGTATTATFFISFHRAIF